MPIRIASRLFRNRHGTFYFRLLIPNDLRACVGRSELRFSLRTEVRQLAVPVSMALVADLPRLFAHLRHMADQLQSPQPDYFKRWIEEKMRSIELRQRLDALTDALTTAERELAHSVSIERARKVVSEAFVRGRLRGKDELEGALVFPPPPERTKPVSELLRAYLTNSDSRLPGATRAALTPKSRAAYEAEIGQFIVVMGDLKLGYIDREIAAHYARQLSRLPKNMNKSPRFRGKSVAEVLAMEPEPQSVQNVSKKLERISTMFGWALKEKRKWGIDSNPFVGYGQSKAVRTTRRPFTVDELISLFSHKSFITRRFGHSYTYWLMPLALFTGARLGELAQLDLKDFVEINGIPCIDINDTVEKTTGEAIDSQVEIKAKSLKTANAKRLVPIHSELIRLGLIRYVEQLRARGETALFPDLSRSHRDGPTHPASKWFQRYRQAAGLTEKQSTVFHSFRHLFITTLLDAGISAQMVAPIVGHEGGLITEQVYWNKGDASKRVPTVEAFRLPEQVTALIPAIEEIQFVTPPGRSPGSRG